MNSSLGAGTREHSFYPQEARYQTRGPSQGTAEEDTVGLPSIPLMTTVLTVGPGVLETQLFPADARRHSMLLSKVKVISANPAQGPHSHPSETQRQYSKTQRSFVKVRNKTRDWVSVDAC